MDRREDQQEIERLRSDLRDAQAQLSVQKAQVEWSNTQAQEYHDKAEEYSAEGVQAILLASEKKMHLQKENVMSH